MSMMSPDLAARGSDSYEGRFPKVNAMGTRPITPDRDGYDSRKGPMGVIRPVSVMATGRFGGSRDMKPGADRNPLSGSRGKGR